MPRPERPFAEEDALTRLAADLRRLRDKAGRPTYRTLAQRAHYSTTTLSDAAGGKRLPSLAVTLAFVEACGGDPGDWERRWREAADEQNVGPAVDRASDECPYPGLAAFQPGDAARFHGREALTGEVAGLVGTHRFVTVFGASGAGKSSLLRAGLIPRLRSAGPVVLFTPGHHPLDECAARIAAHTGGNAPALRRELGVDRRALHLAVLQGLANGPRDAELFLVVDQFEEIFSLCADPAERVAFIDVLLTAAQAANSRTRVVLGVRADFYAHCADFPELAAVLGHGQVLVGPMHTDELRRAVSQPAIDTGATLESALLAQVIADAAGEPNVLPLVSHALRETWHRRRGNTLTLAGYEASGGMHHALARSAESMYQALSPARREQARDTLLRLVTPGDGTEDTKCRIQRDELPADREEALSALVTARLVVVDAGTVELTHEALLRAWPRLRGWIADDRSSLLLRRELSEAASTWERKHHDTADLYRGSRLAAARDWAGRHPQDIGRDSRVRRFLAASIRRQTRARTLGRAAVALLAVLAVTASLTAAYAVRQRGAAEAERDRAVALQTVSESAQVRDTDVSLSAQLMIAAHHMQPTPDTGTGLLGTQNLPLSAVLRGGASTVYGVAFSPDRRTLATSDDDGVIRLWNITDPAAVKQWPVLLTGHVGRTYWVSFSPDGRVLASAGRDGTVRLWDVADPAHAGPAGPPLRGHTSYVFSVSFSPDGHTLVSAGQDRTLRLWNVTDPARATPIGGALLAHDAAVASAVFSPDGRTVASAGHDHLVKLWNVTDPAKPVLWGQPLAGHGDTVYAVAYTADSHTLASVSADRTIRLWNVTDTAHAASLGPPLTGHTDTVFAVAFSHDGHLLATAGADHDIHLWNVTDPANPVPLGHPLTGHTGYVYWLAFSPDDHFLATVGADHLIRLWDLPSTVVVGHTSYVNGIAFSPDGRVLASTGSDRTVRLWNVADPLHPAALGLPLAGNTKAVSQVAFSPDGRTLVSAGRDGVARLWNVTDPAHPAPWAKPVSGSTASLTDAVFSPDGRTLATADADGLVRLWDVADPAAVKPLGPPLAGHTKAVTWLVFSPDGRRLATAGADDTVRLWDVRVPALAAPAGQPLATNTGGVGGIAFSPDGRTLATAGTDHTVRLWDLTGAAPAQLGRPLSGHT
ncbi:hypothetical protein ACGFMK_48895, partial [Amycolatopsis sp. NPDC049252]|uniref:nSTAND1 domain-containing NTPase n=1 Tax=Amycolatopsis sp. NPDC049252 TaxID=3363933 RepID=UPI00371379D9